MGTKEGGAKAAATNKAKYGEDFYSRIGSQGGKKGIAVEVVSSFVQSSPLENNSNYTVLSNGVIIGQKGNPIKPQIDKKGYQRVQVKVPSKHNGVETLKMHRVIAKHFIPNPDNLPQVDHIDGDKCNNDVSNLEWVTNEENARRAAERGVYDYRIPRSVIELGGQVLTAIKEGYIPEDLFRLNEMSRYAFWSAVEKEKIFEEEISTIKLGRKRKYYYFDRSRNKWRVERSDFKAGKQFDTEEEARDYASRGIGGGFYYNRKLAVIAGRKGGSVSRRGKAHA